MKLRSDEWLKLTPLVDNGREIVDFRIWKRTPTGGVPTKKSLIIDDKLIIPLIIALQKVRSQISSQKAHQSTESTRR